MISFGHVGRVHCSSLSNCLMVWSRVFIILEKWLRRSLRRMVDALVETCLERWVFTGSVSLRPLGIRL